MYKKQVHLFKWGCTIYGNENEYENEKQLHRYDINRTRPKHVHRYIKFEMFLSINDGYMYNSIKKFCSWCNNFTHVNNSPCE